MAAAIIDPRALLRAAVVLSSCVLGDGAHAQTAPLEAPNRRVDASTATPAQPASAGGVGVLNLSGALGVLDPDASFRAHAYAGGLALQAVGKHASWPVMIGLGAGVLIFDTDSAPGPSILSSNAAGEVVFGSTRIKRSVELRHAELVLRVQPWWGTARPFLDVMVGFATLFHTHVWATVNGVTLSNETEQVSASVLYGASLGVDWRILSSGPTAAATFDFVVTTGVTRLYTGPMQRPRYINDGTGAPDVASIDAALGLWAPFIALALSLDTRPSARDLTHASNAPQRAPASRP